MQKAKKSDWKILDMPLQTENFKFDIKLTQQEFELLKNGFIPQEMEDKWFMYFEDNKLYIHRSWTGFCIYIVSFSDDGAIQDITVNRNPKQHKETKIEKDKITIQILINNLTSREGNKDLMMQYIKAQG